MIFNRVKKRKTMKVNFPKAVRRQFFQRIFQRLEFFGIPKISFLFFVGEN